MEEQVAFDTIVWLFHASGPQRSVRVCFMGGEPLLRFKLIQKLVPFAKRRAAAHGKRIHFGVTTNDTLVTDRVVDFWRQWGMSFHTSIDGTPDVQDRNRPTTEGRGSSRLVEQSSKRILAYRPGTTARSTVLPDNVPRLVDSYVYFRSLGYTNIAFVPASAPEWNDQHIAAYETQLRNVAGLLIDDFRRGTVVILKGIDDYIEGKIRNSRHKHTCGAGRSMVLVDIHGDIWPCHRWNKASHAPWRIGSIYEGFDDSVRAVLDVPDQSVLLEQECPICPANKFCVGGCPAENLEETGAVYRRHRNACELTRVWARVGETVYNALYAERNACFMAHYFASKAPDTTHRPLAPISTEDNGD
jgi:uncharacterized protein